MFHRFLQLTLFALAASTAYSAGDHLWDIELYDNYPQIVFNNTNLSNEIVFLYNNTGDISGDATKDVTVTVFKTDCITLASEATSLVPGTPDASVGGMVKVELDVVFTYIEASDYWTTLTNTTAQIDFCFRIDYIDTELNETINFHETIVTLTVDLQENDGMTLAGISTTRQDGENITTSTGITYPVEVFHCDDSYGALGDQSPTLQQNVLLQVCVQVNGTDIDVFVENIWSTVLTNADSSVTSTPIALGTTNSITTLVCAAGVCKITMSLLGAFFQAAAPPGITLSGIAVLAFGRRLVQVPIQGTVRGSAASSEEQEQRSLQASGGAGYADYGITMSNIEGTQQSDDGANVGVAVSLSVLGAAALVVFALFCSHPLAKLMKPNKTEKIEPSVHTQYSDSPIDETKQAV
jgi:hypothetical protein